MSVTVVVGAGPVGLVCALALAKQGQDVVIVDPEVGPGPDGSWRRHGVMQFGHPHFFRHVVRECLEAHVPEMWEAVVAAGGVVNAPPEGMPAHFTTLASRRTTFEAALRATASQHPRVRFLHGRAERVVVGSDRVLGVVVDGSLVDADQVIAATGRTSDLADELRPPGEGGPCGQSYVSRMYRALPGVDPLISFAPLGEQYDGYLAVVFPQDAGTHSTLIVRPSDDAGLEQLWRTPAFDAAAAIIPALAPWTDPEGFEPITDPMRGGTLTNTYRGQGTLPAGLFFVGDAVSTTNPSAGRGVGLGLRQAGALLRALAEKGDPKDASAAFDTWCQDNIWPWYDDHVRDDAYLVRRYAGEDLDVEAALPSHVICAAAAEDPALMRTVFPYLGMVTLPSSLGAVEGHVRELLRSGWRPQPAEGPTSADLVDHLAHKADVTGVT